MSSTWTDEELRKIGGATEVAANLNVGNDRQQLIDVITVLLPFIGYPAPSTPSRPSTRSRPQHRKNTDMTARNWLITGVSSGFGRELAADREGSPDRPGLTP